MDDRELETLLAVEPSPEFLVRVRSAITDAPIASPLRRFVPALGGVAALAVLVLAAVISVSRPNGLAPARASAPHVTAGAARIEVPLAPAVEAPPPPPTNVRRIRARAVTTVASGSSNVPEVMVSAEDVRSFHEVVASAAARRFEISPEGMQALLGNTIPDIAIAPVDSFVNDQGALQ